MNNTHTNNMSVDFVVIVRCRELIGITLAQYCNQSPLPDDETSKQAKSIGKLINLDKFIAFLLEKAV